jgi:hypothetical protein
MSDLNLGSIKPINDFPSPDKPTWPLKENLVDGKLPTGNYRATSKPEGYPSNAAELVRRPSPLLAWYGNSAPVGCVVGRSGVVTSANVHGDKS